MERMLVSVKRCIGRYQLERHETVGFPPGPAAISDEAAYELLGTTFQSDRAQRRMQELFAKEAGVTSGLSNPQFDELIRRSQADPDWEPESGWMDLPVSKEHEPQFQQVNHDYWDPAERRWKLTGTELVQRAFSKKDEKPRSNAEVGGGARRPATSERGAGSAMRSVPSHLEAKGVAGGARRPGFHHSEAGGGARQPPNQSDWQRQGGGQQGSARPARGRGPGPGQPTAAYNSQHGHKMVLVRLRQFSPPRDLRQTAAVATKRQRGEDHRK